MAKKENNRTVRDGKPMPLGKTNYMWMGVGLLLLIVGFLLMAGGGSQDPNEFNYAMFSFRRITLAPITVLAGFCVFIYAIMKKNRSVDTDRTTDNNKA